MWIVPVVLVCLLYKNHTFDVPISGKTDGRNISSGSDARPSHRWPRFGYRRLGVPLRWERMAVNHKRIYRDCTEEDLRVRGKRKMVRSRVRTAPLAVPSKPNERWSMDFMQDCPADGGRFRVLTIVDDFTRKCPGGPGSGEADVCAGAAAWDRVGQWERAIGAGLGCLGKPARGSSSLRRTREPKAERLRGKLPRKVPGGMPEPALVHGPLRCA